MVLRGRHFIQFNFFFLSLLVESSQQLGELMCAKFQLMSYAFLNDIAHLLMAFDLKALLLFSELLMSLIPAAAHEANGKLNHFYLQFIYGKAEINNESKDAIRYLDAAL